VITARTAGCSPVGRQIAPGFAANHGGRRHFLVLDDRDAWSEALVVLAKREMKPRLIALLQYAEGQDRVAEGAAHVAEVVARAFLADVLGLDHRVAGRGQKQLGEPRFAIAHDDAVHLDDVSKRHERLRFRRLDEQEVRSEIAMPRPQHVRRRRRLYGAAATATDGREAGEQLR